MMDRPAAQARMDAEALLQEEQQRVTTAPFVYVRVNTAPFMYVQVNTAPLFMCG